MHKEDILQLFLEEAIERLNDLSNLMLQLENNPDDTELLKHLFRVAHTLKGNGSTAHNTISDLDPDEKSLIHIDKIAKITHAMENLIMEARDNGLELDEERIEVLFETEETIETLISYVQSGEEEELNVEDLYEKLTILSSSSEKVKKEKKVTKTREEKNDSLNHLPSYTFKISLNCDEDYKHAFLSLVYRDIEEKFENPVFKPSFDDLMTGEDFTDISISISTDVSETELIDFISQLENVESVVNTNEVEAEVEKDEVKIVEKENEPSPSVEEKTKIEPKKSSSTKHLLTNSNIRVPIQRIDSVLKHVSSLVILKNKLSTHSKNLKSEEAKLLQDISEEISQTVDFLQESVMQIRMTPLEQLFGRFPKDVRKTAKEFGKKVKFEYSGAETEIDKSLLEQLSDPLMHLIRNSIFHGIEGEKERLERGKSIEGKLTLSAKHEQSMVVITVEDDGGGIDIEKVTNKAIQKGILSEDKARVMSDMEKVMLIFHSGLSTAESVNNVAGRGVGMDAVRTKIESMKGTISVHTELGKGTKTVIRLPLTLAIIQAMLTKISNEFFAFPLSQIESVETIQTKDIKFVANKEVYVLRDLEVPILRLDEFFGIRTKEESREKNTLDLVILKIGDRTIGASVDSHIGQEDIVVKNIGKYLGDIPGISGCNILGDGSISLIVDVNGLITNVSKS